MAGKLTVASWIGYTFHPSIPANRIQNPEPELIRTGLFLIGDRFRGQISLNSMVTKNKKRKGIKEKKEKTFNPWI